MESIPGHRILSIRRCIGEGISGLLDRSGRMDRLRKILTEEESYSLEMNGMVLPWAWDAGVDGMGIHPAHFLAC